MKLYFSVKNKNPEKRSGNRKLKINSEVLFPFSDFNSFL